ncbi:hypothetical protein PBY51_005774 [Eleginops maclovinus]|uniref:Uncharacterized protein n=1 Tax=Eleginops maclovinus TaxID=56733 RepID=A0AAN7WPY1_ELEMC|nr:hypothetical protein PBY51_005774 [Eleginops maclovinus]
MGVGSVLLCVLLSFVSAKSIFEGSSSHHVQRRDTKPNRNHTAVIGTELQVFPTWYVSARDTVVINCTMHTDRKKHGDRVNLHLTWTKMSPGNRT